MPGEIEDVFEFMTLKDQVASLKKKLLESQRKEAFYRRKYENATGLTSKRKAETPKRQKALNMILERKYSQREIAKECELTRDQIRYMVRQYDL